MTGLRSDRIVCPEGVVAGEITVADGRIAAVQAGARGAGEVLDFGSWWLVPGFIDGHVHGGGGAQFNTTDPDEIDRAARFHARHGTTGLLATTVAAPLDELCAAVAAIAERARAPSLPGAEILGVHLEGPFLSTERPGAMDPEVFLDPDPAALERLLEAGAGTVRMMTIAPEPPGALALIQRLSEAGVIASLGHTDATFEEAEEALGAGARAVTHLFNAMRPLHHREPGVLGAALDLGEVSCELICDGVHVAPAVARMVHRLKGTAGVRLVTDAIQAAGMPDGHYRLGAAAVEVRDGRATLAGGESIAGSTLTMDAALRNAVSFLNVTVEEAVLMASTNPARLLGLGQRKGSIAAGMDADLVLLDEELRVRGTMVSGAWALEPA